MDKNMYQINIEGAGISLKREISASVAHRIINIVLGSNNVESGVSNPEIPPLASTGNEITPKAFMASKSPKTDIEKITCLAYYLTHHRQTKEFKTRELTDLNREAAQPKFSNPAVSARNAADYTYLTSAGSGKKQITSLGEELVDALPDRDKVKTAVEGSRPRKRRNTKSKKRRSYDNR